MTDTGTITSSPVISRLVAVGGMVLIVGILVFFSTLIWPGQATITRHVLCDDGHPDAYVVRSTRTQTGVGDDNGTSVDFRMWCVSPSGVAQNRGWARPFALLALGYAVALWILLRITRARIRRRVQDAGGGPIITNAP